MKSRWIRNLIYYYYSKSPGFVLRFHTWSSKSKKGFLAATDYIVLKYEQFIRIGSHYTFRPLKGENYSQILNMIIQDGGQPLQKHELKKIRENGIVPRALPFSFSPVSLQKEASAEERAWVEFKWNRIETLPFYTIFFTTAFKSVQIVGWFSQNHRNKNPARERGRGLFSLFPLPIVPRALPFSFSSASLTKRGLWGGESIGRI